MSDLPVKTMPERDGPYGPEGLLIEAVDEAAQREARERMAARVRLLWNNRRFLIQAAVWGLIIATAVAFLIPKQYESTSQLMPPDQNAGSGAAMLAALSNQVGAGLASVAQSALGVNTSGDLFVGILESDTVRDDVIRKFNLQQVYGTDYIEDTRKALAGNTAITEDEKSGIIAVTVTDHNPRRAQAMAKEYVNELNWVVAHLSTSAAHRERVFLDQRLNEVKADLEHAEKQFSQFASQTGAINIPAQGEAMVTAAATLQGQLIAAEAELRALRQMYTNNNVRVRSFQAQVNELRQQLEKIGGKGASETSSAQQLYPSLRELPLLGVTYADLLRRTKVEETVFELLTQQDELAKIQEAKEIPSVKVLDPPGAPQKKSFPPRLLIIILGTVLGFVFCAGWILACSAWNAVDPSDPHKALALDVWADLRTSRLWNDKNGSRIGHPANWLKRRFRRADNGSPGASRSEEAAQDKR